MATPDEIRARITSAQTLALTNQDLVDLCDMAMADFLSGRPTSYTIAGRSFNFQTIDQIRQAREYYTNAPSSGGRGFICQNAEL